MTTTAAGNAGTDTSIVCTAIATDVRLDGVTERKRDGATAVYLPAKPRSTAAKPTRMRDVPTTITRMSLGGSSFGAPSLRFTVAWSFTKALADPNGRVTHHLSTDL